MLSCLTFLFWYRTLKVQNVDRRTLPVKSNFQPANAIYGATGAFIVVLIAGIPVLVKGHWDTITFVSSYFALPFSAIVFLSYKYINNTKLVRPEEVDLFTEKKEIDKYEENFVEKRPSNIVTRLLDRIF